MPGDETYMRAALQLAGRGYGATSPNPMVGALVVRVGQVIGRGWHRRAGEPHAEINALADAAEAGRSLRGAALYVTLEPCSTHGRTPPCTEAIVKAGLKRVVVGTIDPNPKHAGRGFDLLRRAGVDVVTGVLQEECTRLNEAFNHWIVHRTPFVTLKAAMTLDGKIATASGESKWITGEKARAAGMRLRRGADAILVGVNTVLLDDPSLTVRRTEGVSARAVSGRSRDAEDNVLSREDAEDSVPAICGRRGLRRIILDTRARTPLGARVVSDPFAELTTIVVGPHAPKSRVARLSRRVRTLVCPSSTRSGDRIDLAWVLQRLGEENVTSLLVEGGGEVNGSFVGERLVQRVIFFYAPKILGGRKARHAVEGQGIASLPETLKISAPEWRKVGDDLMLTGRIA